MQKSNRTKQTNRSHSRGNLQPESESEGMDTALHKLFLDELADVYHAEQQLTKALPKMIKAAESEELRQALESHLEETKQQISRLEEVAESLNETLKRKTCKGMQGIIAEGQEMLEEEEDSSALDAAIIAAAQKVEHYEIASYGTLCAWAELMGHDEAMQLLRQTLDEEEAADEKLTSVAESVANQRAQAE
jgi:ferritin-like metal-binding protein YciE